MNLHLWVQSRQGSSNDSFLLVIKKDHAIGFENLWRGLFAVLSDLILCLIGGAGV